MLTTTVRENGLAMSVESIESLVSKTFAAVDLGRDGFIDREEFRLMTVGHPNMLRPLSLNIREIMEHLDGDAGGGGVGVASGGKSDVGDDSKSPRR